MNFRRRLCRLLLAMPIATASVVTLGQFPRSQAEPKRCGVNFPEACAKGQFSAEVIDQVSRTVVALQLAHVDKDNGHLNPEPVINGTGFWLNKEGMLVTALHVWFDLYDGWPFNLVPIASVPIGDHWPNGPIDDRGSVRFPVEFVGRDEDHDLALLKVIGQSPFEHPATKGFVRVAELKGLRLPKPSTPLAFVGFSFGQPTPNVTFGTAGHSVPSLHCGSFTRKDVLTAEMGTEEQPGVSGGPVFSSSGTVVGAVVAFCDGQEHIIPAMFIAGLLQKSSSH